MPKRKNLIHDKLKNASPNDMVHLHAVVPAHLLSDIKTYGDMSKVVQKGLESIDKTKFIAELKSNILTIQQSMEKLNLENEKDQAHIELLEIYRDCFFRMKGAKVLRKSYRP